MGRCEHPTGYRSEEVMHLGEADDYFDVGTTTCMLCTQVSVNNGPFEDLSDAYSAWRAIEGAYLAHTWSGQGHA
jgi:hypothetical protein